jgi:hypothetical protein
MAKLRTKRNMKATAIDKAAQETWPLVPILSPRIARTLKEAGISQEELLKGLEEQRARLFHERYPNDAKPKCKKG